MAKTKPALAAQDGPALVHIASRVLNRPLLLHPTKAEVILHVLEGRLSLDGAVLADLAPDANRFLGRNLRADGSLKLNRAENGVALIPIVGSLVNRGAWIGSQSGLVSYEGLDALLREAEADPDIRAVVLDIDSPGGEATGMFTVAEQVRRLNAQKPVTAFVNDMAASAAYGIASAAQEIVVSPTSIVGSIGVVLTHMDRSAEMAKKGVKATLIYAGAHKVDGHPFGPLSESVQADLQAEVMAFYDQFVGLVARGRTGLTEAAIRGTQARTFIGQDAIARGLADRIASLDDILKSLATRAPAATTQRTGFAMSKSTEAAPRAENAGISPEAHASALDSVRAEGAAAERARITAILRSDAANGREAQALAFALDTDIDADAAIKVLAAAPKAVATAVPSIAERATAEREFGGTTDPSHIHTSAQLWSKAVQSANRAIGAGR